MTTSELVELLKQSREYICGCGEDKNECCDCRECTDGTALLDRIDAAIESQEKVEWHPLNPSIQEAYVVRPDTVNLLVERMVFKDGKIGWWGRYNSGTIGCFDTEEEAKAACLKAVKDVAECFEKIAKRNKRLK